MKAWALRFAPLPVVDFSFGTPSICLLRRMRLTNNSLLSPNQIPSARKQKGRSIEMYLHFVLLVGHGTVRFGRK